MDTTTAELPTNVRTLVEDAIAAGNRAEVEVSSRSIHVQILEGDGSDTNENDWWAAYWRLTDQGWRYWYTTDGNKESMTLRELRTWVTNRHHLSNRQEQ